MWNGSRGLDGSGGSDLSRGSDEYIGSGGHYVNSGSGGFRGSRSSGSSGYHGSGDSGSGGSGSANSGGPYVYDGSGGSAGPCVYDESRGSAEPYVYHGSRDFAVFLRSERPCVYDGSAGAGGFRGFGGSHGSNSHSRSDGYIDCYFVTLAGLWGWTIAQLEQHTRVKASVKKTLPEVAAFYQQAGYSDRGYQEFDKCRQLKKYLSQVFTHERERTASHQSKYLRMKLAAGWKHFMKPNGHAGVLEVWTQNGKLIFQVVDYTFDGDRRTATKRAVPQSEVKSYFCFEPIFYFESTETNPFNPDLY